MVTLLPDLPTPAPVALPYCTISPSHALMSRSLPPPLLSVSLISTHHQ